MGYANAVSLTLIEGSCICLSVLFPSLLLVAGTVLNAICVPFCGQDNSKF